MEKKIFIMCMATMWLLLAIAAWFVPNDPAAGRTAVIIFNIWFAAWMVKS